MKRITQFVILSMLLILLCACTPQNSTAGDTSSNKDASSSTQSSSQNSTQSSDSSQPAQWPDEFKGKLPTPVCKITDVMRYDENSMSGKLTIVNFSDMSKADAEAYVESLKAMGFSGGVNLNDGTKIVFSGVSNDESAKNGVNFMYVNSDQTGTISY